jgi:spectinomycin phosphotransferase
VRTAPPDLAEDRLVSVLTASWALDVDTLRYAPVGFGSHHWVATGGGSRWFVTVDATDDVDRLGAALDAARALQTEAGLPFVVGARPALDGRLLQPVTGRYVASVFPYVDGTPWPEDGSVADRAAVVDVLARLHAATDQVRDRARSDDLRIEARESLERSLRELAQPWTGGPFSAEVRELVAAAADRLRDRLASYDAFVAAARAGRTPWVVTHGEPKPDNLLLTERGPVLVDWDTALLAPPARDLWWVADHEDALAGYAAATGRPVPDGEVPLYRLRWPLTDVALYVRDLRGPHERTADTELAWRALRATVAELTAPATSH